MKKGTNLVLQNKEIFRKEENGVLFRMETNAYSTLVTKITKEDNTVYDSSNYLLVGENRNSTLVIRCNSAEEAEKRYSSLEYTKHKMSFDICQNNKIESSPLDYYIDFMKKNSHLCNGHCGKCTVCGHPLMVYHCQGFTAKDVEHVKYRSLNTEDTFDEYEYEYVHYDEDLDDEYECLDEEYLFDEDLYLEDEDEDEDEDLYEEDDTEDEEVNEDEEEDLTIDYKESITLFERYNGVDYKLFEKIINNDDMIMLANGEEYIFVGIHGITYHTITDGRVEIRIPKNIMEVMDFIKSHIENEYSVYI